MAGRLCGRLGSCGGTPAVCASCRVISMPARRAVSRIRRGCPAERRDAWQRGMGASGVPYKSDSRHAGPDENILVFAGPATSLLAAVAGVSPAWLRSSPGQLGADVACASRTVGPQYLVLTSL